MYYNRKISKLRDDLAKLAETSTGDSTLELIEGIRRAVEDIIDDNEELEEEKDEIEEERDKLEDKLDDAEEEQNLIPRNVLCRELDEQVQTLYDLQKLETVVEVFGKVSLEQLDALR